ncbi:MAG: 1-acyl-sn-glycerol-3-phosphate acyltransferase [Xanthomonadales bacterium]|nr:1-acyl-sn-glycerol-3-phosphate acyltransferase [Xanthomonadales bacterium]
MGMNSPFRRALRYIWRIPLLVWHVLVDLPVTILLMAEPWGGKTVGGIRLGHRAVRWWSRTLMRIYGLDVRASGTQLPDPVLFVANHVGWTDIVVLHSTRMMGFVAKREIAGWPVVGWMAKKGQTIFHQRGSQESLGDVLQQMVERLREGHSVGAFPEGGTRDGRELGPFHARLFYASVEADVAVQPVALCYGTRGDAQTVIAFRKRESFARNFWRLLGEPARTVDVVYLAPILPGEVEGRSRIADLARERIGAALQGS